MCIMSSKGSHWLDGRGGSPRSPLTTPRYSRPTQRPSAPHPSQPTAQRLVAPVPSLSTCPTSELSLTPALALHTHVSPAHLRPTLLYACLRACVLSRKYSGPPPSPYTSAPRHPGSQRTYFPAGEFTSRRSPSALDHHIRLGNEANPGCSDRTSPPNASVSVRHPVDPSAPQQDPTRIQNVLSCPTRVYYDASTVSHFLWPLRCDRTGEGGGVGLGVNAGVGVGVRVYDWSTTQSYHTRSFLVFGFIEARLERPVMLEMPHTRSCAMGCDSLCRAGNEFASARPCATSHEVVSNSGSLGSCGVVALPVVDVRRGNHALLWAWSSVAISDVVVKGTRSVAGLVVL
ncbi:hypothetical protein DFP72DRAFT_850361 [Ephemerocybe angulata]|uniref:Uncharacterized protein n=1 Tax=Ephemerocybe angulata TaxID=980116 RepID=A0A8H6M563_9AGAR|nr:hypothetical protein DFP72DRAFT_850361 [Tulosesus angulatus]